MAGIKLPHAFDLSQACPNLQPPRLERIDPGIAGLLSTRRSPEPAHGDRGRCGRRISAAPGGDARISAINSCFPRPTPKDSGPLSSPASTPEFAATSTGSLFCIIIAAFGEFGFVRHIFAFLRPLAHRIAAVRDGVRIAHVG